jgi:SAM-dependent MidA family methyltransferase
MSIFLLLKKRIQETGPLSIWEYMDLCLNHPAKGYYQIHDPIGPKGDFITAPEISQLFGEMIGLWALDSWGKIGSPLPVQVIEMGPGRGTLMRDMSRVWKIRPDFLKHVSIHLLENSPMLTEIQKSNLQGLQVTWHRDLKDLLKSLEEAPQFWIANEFFDALPIHQFVWTETGWRERLVGLEKGELVFTLASKASQRDMPDAGNLPYGTIYEVNSALEEMGKSISQCIKTQGGGILFVDYGEKEGWGDTLQAIYHHQKVSLLQRPGMCDLTAHVQFANLQKNFLKAGIQTTLKTQSDFLREMGIEFRAQQLIKKATIPQKSEITNALLRLLGKETSQMQMGSLFKVLYGVRSLLPPA